MPYFYISLSMGVFPNQWKLAKIVPIAKGGSSQDVSNFRLISLLSVPAKIFESHIQYLGASSVTKNLSKTTRFCSQEINFVNTSEFLLDALRINKRVDVVYTNFSKAFDTINPQILIRKMQANGFSSSL